MDTGFYWPPLMATSIVNYLSNGPGSLKEIDKMENLKKQSSIGVL